MTRPRPSGEWASEYLAPCLAQIFAARAVAADDDHGRGAGIVTQAGGLRWDESLSAVEAYLRRAVSVIAGQIV